MDEVLPNLIEEFEDYLDTYTEYEGELDDENAEARRIHEEIGTALRLLSRQLNAFASDGDDPTPDQVEELEEALAELGDAFAELAATL